MDLVHKRVLPAENVPGRPPVAQEGMLTVGDEHAAESPGLLAALLGPVDFELVQSLQVEGDRAGGPVDLDGEMVPPAGGDARRLQRADRAADKLHDGGEGVVDLDGGRSLRARQGPLTDEGP